MEPAYKDGGFAFCWTPSYLFHPPRRFDVVAVKLAGREVVYLKRFVALEGEEVEFRGGVLLVDGKPLDEPYVKYRFPWDLAPRKVERTRAWCRRGAGNGREWLRSLRPPRRGWPPAPSRRPVPTRAPSATGGPSSSVASTRSTRWCVRAAVARCGSSRSSPSRGPFTRSSGLSLPRAPMGAARPTHRTISGPPPDAAAASLDALRRWLDASVLAKSCPQACRARLRQAHDLQRTPKSAPTPARRGVGRGSARSPGLDRASQRRYHDPG